MKKIIAKNKKHLKRLIKQEMKQHGNECDLNHIDVYQVTDMNEMFMSSQFNGDISQWDVSNVETMNSMFAYSLFNGNISKWNSSKVKDISSMFEYSQFNGDVSQWDVSNIDHMNLIFSNSQFNQDLSDWKPLSVIKKENMFTNSNLENHNNIPYWAEIESEFMPTAINAYELQKKLNQELNQPNIKNKQRMKV